MRKGWLPIAGLGLIIRLQCALRTVRSNFMAVLRYVYEKFEFKLNSMLNQLGKGLGPKTIGDSVS